MWILPFAYSVTYTKFSNIAMLCLAVHPELFICALHIVVLILYYCPPTLLLFLFFFLFLLKYKLNFMQ